jgi:hypothetical protein
MTMLPLTIICDSQAHCTACRANTSEGRAFRIGLVEHYDIPGVTDVFPRGGISLVDFPCPRGRSLGEITLPPSIPTASSAILSPRPEEAFVIPDGALKICQTCSIGISKMCMSYCPGCGGGRIDGPCQAGKW